MELNKITLVGWVNKVLEQSLTKKISSLNLRPHLYGLSIPRQWIIKLNFHKHILQNQSMIKEVKMT